MSWWLSRVGSRISAGLVVLALVSPAGAWAQTPVSAPSNKFSPQDDVKLGTEAAAEVRRQFPLVRDRDVDRYVEDVGARLVQAIPPQFHHPEFRYAFDVVNARDINAFALPGGPSFVNRGMIEAARSEGEMAGVMAHEIAHVALRHGTAQATKAQKYQLGALAGAILGSIVGGRTGQVISQGTQFGIGTYFLKFSREYEKQADLLGAQILANAGYDPRDLASMFRTIEQQSGGGGGPEWLNSHPNPGNRYNYILAEAQQLQVRGRAGDARRFASVKEELRGMPRAPTMAEISRAASRGTAPAGVGEAEPDARVMARVEAPSSRYLTYDEGNLFRVTVPENWRELAGGNAVRFAPQGAYGRVRGQDVFTHGVEMGVVRTGSANLQRATQEFISALAESNRSLRSRNQTQRRSLGGRGGLLTALSNVSDATGQREAVLVHTTLLPDGNLFYVISVAPEDEYAAYSRTFERVSSSIRFTS
jgi:Zn-dependent protease with chaperone function